MFRSKLVRVSILACGLGILGGCPIETDKESLLSVTVIETADFDSDSALAWFDLLTASIEAEGLNAPEAARIVGYAGVTAYESVVGGMPTHQSLEGQLNGLGNMPNAPDGWIHWPSVLNAAMADVLTDLFAGASPATLQAITDLETQLATGFVGEASQGTIDSSSAYGEEIAEEIIDWIADDGFAAQNDCAYTPPIGDGQWVPTPPGLAPALEPCWGNLRPFALLFSANCTPAPGPPFSRTAGSSFALEAQEVYDTDGALTQTQMDIALFWEDDTGTLTPAGHWVSITSQIIDEEGEDLDVAVEAYAKVGIASADAFISSWETKYSINLLRPITYVQDPAGPINDPAWSSFLAAPPFPEFAAVHAVQAGAAALVIEDVLGDGSFTDHTHDGAGMTPRSFGSPTEAAQEAAISRLYGGVNFRSGFERGLQQGQCIGQTILQTLQFGN